MTENKKYLWKYLSLDKFNLLLKDKAIYLPSLKKLQISMDPIEGATSKRLVNSAIKELQSFNTSIKTQKEAILSFEKHRKSILTYAYIYSMAYSEDENYALWNIYTTNLKGNVQIDQGLSLRMDEEFFKEIFVNKNIQIQNNNYNSDISMPLLKDMLYKSKQEILEIINSDNKINNIKEFEKILHEVLIIKNDFYDFAKEKRYIVKLDYDIDAVKNCDDNVDKSFIKVNYDIQKFFNPDYCKIIISPFANDTLMDYIKYLLKKQGIKCIDKIVCKSEIAMPD